MSLISDSTSAVLHTSLRMMDVRIATHQDNVANVSTPGFLAKRVEFEDRLAQAIASGDGLGSVEPTVVVSADPTDPTGNNVDLGKEMVQLTESALRQQLLVRAMNDRYGRLRVAAGDF